MPATPHQYRSHCQSAEDGKGCSREGCCPICDGGLSVCKICGLFEGALTTDCPGARVFSATSDRIYRGDLDYRDGHWIEGQPSSHCPLGIQLAAQQS